MQSTERYRTRGKFSFRSVLLGVTVGHFIENCSHPFRLKVDFQAERSSCSRSVPFRSAEKDNTCRKIWSRLLFLAIGIEIGQFR
uniref:Uncharacterized protein n=1 Tax=Romanomermis culicivorax TaxID=13658 RepID=A0A915KFV5_ROMCU